jgi:hypothetical protein
MAILILFIAGKTRSYPLPRDAGKKVVTILPYLIDAIWKRDLTAFGGTDVAASGRGVSSNRVCDA